jgi:hypothetical protein
MAKRQDAIPEITLGEQVPVVPAAPPVVPVVQVTREIATVVIEVPICTNPPARGYTTPPHVNVHLTQSKTKEGRHVLHGLHWGLKEIGAKMANGRLVRDRTDALVWLLDQINEANSPADA